MEAGANLRQVDEDQENGCETSVQTSVLDALGTPHQIDYCLLLRRSDWGLLAAAETRRLHTKFKVSLCDVQWRRKGSREDSVRYVWPQNSTYYRILLWRQQFAKDYFLYESQMASSLITFLLTVARKIILQSPYLQYSLCCCSWRNSRIHLVRSSFLLLLNWAIGSLDTAASCSHW